MPITLTADQLAQSRHALLGTRSDGLIELMFELALHRVPGPQHALAQGDAARLGWVDASGMLTPLGTVVADPIREYRFWLARDRRLHGENDHDLLKPERYAGRSVLEPGCGFGCNLLSLSRVEGRFVGLEPVALYRQLTPLFAEREGLRPPEVVDGRAEALPFSDGEFDVVLCYSSHQYMDVAPALREMARVLRPGGQLQVVGGTLEVALGLLRRQWLAHPSLGNLRAYGLTLANTLSYERWERRLYVPRGAAATTAPVYPRVPHMQRWMQRAGLRPRSDLMRRVGTELCFVADKPG